MNGWLGKVEAARSVALCALTWVPLLFLSQLAIGEEQWECRFLLSDSGTQFPEVREFLEDHQGRIWASSWGGGVACIQGTTWKTYTERDGLASDWVRGLALGDDGTVWISTPGGICYFQNEALHCLDRSSIQALSGDETDLIFMTQDGDLILSTFKGALFRIRGASKQASLFWEEPGQWDVLLSPEDPGAVRAADFEEDREGDVVVTFKDDTWAVIKGNQLERTMGPGGTMYVSRDPAGEAPLGVWGASARDEDYSIIYTLSAGPSEPRHTLQEEVRGLATGQDGWCYAGTTAGLFRFNGVSLERVDLGHEVGFPDINEVFFASDGGLWLGAREGLVRGAPCAWKHYTKTRENHPLIALVKDPAQPGQMLAVDDQFCLARLENDSWVESFPLATPEGLNGFSTFGAEPVVWAMGSTTLYRFDISDGGLSGSYPLPPTGVDRKLFMTSSGELWITALDGVYALIEGHWEARPKKAGYTRRTANAICEVGPGDYFVGLRDGIERWEGDTITYYGEKSGIAQDDSVYAICKTKQGEIWFGTYGSGVYVFDGNNFKHIDESDGLAHHSISNIIQTQDETIWLSYRRVGIASYRRGRWLNFSYANGLTNSPIKQLLEAPQGGLWLVTKREGLYRYRPDREPPETVITAATEAVPSQGIGVFSFHATDAWQRTPTHILRYSWRVLDTNRSVEVQPWCAYTSETSTVIGALAPGRYRFEVRASDDARNVDPTPAFASFEIAVPLWREPRVYLPVGFMVLLLAGAMMLRVRAHYALRQSEAALLQSNQQLMNEIKERLQAEQRLNDHFEQLEELVRGRTEELEAAQRALVEQERLATLGKVTASVSHELRNPLGTLRSTLFMIGRKVAGHNLGLDDALARGERSIQRCDRIIEEFLDFTRTVAMERQRIRMDSWLKEVVLEMQLPPDIYCRYTLESRLELDVDPERLRRAVVNVVNNAVQAMQEGEIEHKRLHIKTRVRSGRFEIVLKDSGPGMSEESLERIFEPLYSTKGFGVGLGVPIVKGIMAKHQGGVEYYSTLGEGTTVILWIPAEIPPSVAHHIPEGDDEASGEDGHAQ